MLIYKEELLNNTGISVLELPFLNVTEAKENILKIDLQRGKPHMWYSVPDDREKKEFLIISIGTGHLNPAVVLEEYIGSVLVCEDMFVWHYFITDRQTLNERGFQIKETYIVEED